MGPTASILLPGSRYITAGLDSFRREVSAAELAVVDVAGPLAVSRTDHELRSPFHAPPKPSSGDRSRNW
eukprot:6206350-Pleurochrysis_carterae.AAC.3